MACWDWVAEAKDTVAAAVARHAADRDRITAAHEQAELTWNEEAGDPVAAVVRELGRFVEALGGRLEFDPASGDPVAAVFADGRVALAPLTETEDAGDR